VRLKLLKYLTQVYLHTGSRAKIWGGYNFVTTENITQYTYIDYKYSIYNQCGSHPVVGLVGRGGNGDTYYNDIDIQGDSLNMLTIIFHLIMNLFKLLSILIGTGFIIYTF